MAKDNYAHESADVQHASKHGDSMRSKLDTSTGVKANTSIPENTRKAATALHVADQASNADHRKLVESR